MRTTLLLTARPLPADLLRRQRRGIGVVVLPFARDTSAYWGRLKLVGHPSAVVGRIAAARRGAGEALYRNAAGEVTELRASIDHDTRTGNPKDGRKIGGAIHWVSAPLSKPVELRLYDRLFTVPNPGTGETDFRRQLNPRSLEVVAGARMEPALAGARPEDRWQFERKGYYVADRKDSKQVAPVFNLIVPLRDTWAKT